MIKVKQLIQEIKDNSDATIGFSGSTSLVGGINSTAEPATKALNSPKNNGFQSANGLMQQAKLRNTTHTNMNRVSSQVNVNFEEVIFTDVIFIIDGGKSEFFCLNGPKINS
eukprot:403362768